MRFVSNGDDPGKWFTFIQKRAWFFQSPVAPQSSIWGSHYFEIKQSFTPRLEITLEIKIATQMMAQ